MERAGSDGRSGPVARASSRLVSRSRAVGDVSFRAFLASRDAPRLQFASPAGLELAGSGVATRVTAAGPDRFDVVRRAASAAFDDADYDAGDAERDLGVADGDATDDSDVDDTDGGAAGDSGAMAAARPRFVGGFAFRDDHEATPPWEGFPAASFVLPEAQLTRTNGGTWLTMNEFGPDATPASVERSLDEAVAEIDSLPKMRPAGEPPGVVGTTRTTPKDAWTNQVADAVSRIEAGDLEKVVLACALEVDLDSPADLPDVLERLRRTYPNCYRFLVQPTETGGFLGAPPERLVDKRGRRVETEALAGSVGRGGTPEADAELAQSLVDSAKIQHEQRLVVDAICDQLRPLGDVTEGEQVVRKLDNIQHLQTPIEATLDEPVHVLDIVEALHPTPAVGGLPPDAAAETISDVETFDRGWYAAPVGWFDAAGDGEFLVGIRSGVVGGTKATLFAGNGIVRDSDPQEEWDEIQLKYRPLLDEFQ